MNQLEDSQSGTWKTDIYEYHFSHWNVNCEWGWVEEKVPFSDELLQIFVVSLLCWLTGVISEHATWGVDCSRGQTLNSEEYQNEEQRQKKTLTKTQFIIFSSCCSISKDRSRSSSRRTDRCCWPCPLDVLSSEDLHCFTASSWRSGWPRLPPRNSRVAARQGVDLPNVAQDFFEKCFSIKNLGSGKCSPLISFLLGEFEMFALFLIVNF